MDGNDKLWRCVFCTKLFFCLQIKPDFTVFFCWICKFEKKRGLKKSLVISQNFICRHIYNKNKKTYFYPNFAIMKNITAMKSRKTPKSSAVGQIKIFFFRKEPLERHWRRKFSFFLPKSISTIVKNIFNEGNVWKKFFKVKKIKKLKKKHEIFPLFSFQWRVWSLFVTKKHLGGVFGNNIHITLRLKHKCCPPLPRPLI